MQGKIAFGVERNLFFRVDIQLLGKEIGAYFLFPSKSLVTKRFTAHELGWPGFSIAFIPGRLGLLVQWRFGNE